MGDPVQAPPPVDEMLCFALYRASRAMIARYRPLLAPHELTYPQYLVLLVLDEERVASVRAIGRRLQLDSGTLSPLLRRLEQRGLVARRRSDADERSVEISLTDAGRALCERLREVPPLVQEATSLDEASAAELRDQLHRLAERVAADAERAGAAPG